MNPWWLPELDFTKAFQGSLFAISGLLSFAALWMLYTRDNRRGRIGIWLVVVAILLTTWARLTL